MSFRLSGFQKGYLVAIPVLLTLGICVGLWQGPPIPIIVGSVAGIAWVWLAHITIPFEISLDNHQLNLVSMRGSTRIPCGDILSIDAREWNRGFIYIRHRNGTVAVLRRMRGALILVTAIQEENPAVSVRADWRS